MHEQQDDIDDEVKNKERKMVKQVTEDIIKNANNVEQGASSYKVLSLIFCPN